MLLKPCLLTLCGIFACVPFALGKGPDTTGDSAAGVSGPTKTGSSGTGLSAVFAAIADLSTLSSLVIQHPGLIANFSGTILAPSNAALEQYIANAGGRPALTPAVIFDLLSYHVFPSTYSISDLSQAGGRLLGMSLGSSCLAHLGPPLAVFASASYGSSGLGLASTPSHLRIYSGFGTPAIVIRGDILYDRGVVHIIDR